MSIEGGGGPQGANTLDEPVLDTLKRDLLNIAIKEHVDEGRTRHVILPNGKGTTALRDWDLWGPLLMCFLLAIVIGLSTTNTVDDNGRKSLMFSVVFVIVCGGSIIATLNAKFLGGQVSIFQAVCVIGYCMFPLVLAALIIAAVAFANFTTILFRGPVVLVALIWSTWASVGFMAALVEPRRKLLAVYPVLLFYLIIAWLTIITVR